MRFFKVLDEDSVYGGREFKLIRENEHDILVEGDGTHQLIFDKSEVVEVKPEAG